MKPVDFARFKVLLVDDHPTTRMALRQFFILHGFCSGHIFEAADWQSASHLLETHNLDYVILDLHLKGPFGTELLRKYASTLLSTKFVVYTQSEELYYLKESLRLGAFSILTKDSTIECLAENLKKIFSGKKVFPAQLLESEQLMGDSKLSGREVEVAFFIAQGKSNKEIAKILNCSDQTIKSHRSSILRKIGVDNSIAASVILVKQGLI